MPQKEIFDWKKTIYPNIVMLKLAGLWPKDDDTYSKNLYTLYAAISVGVFQLCGLTLPLIASLFFLREGAEALTSVISVVAMSVSIVLKSCFIIKNMKLLKQLMRTVNSDLFQPKNLRQEELATANLRSWKNIARTFWFFAACYSLFLALFPILDKGYLEHRLPFVTWYPYDYKKSPQYEITYLYQIISMNFVSASNVNSNTLIAALNMYIAAQFDIVYDDLVNLRKTNDTSSDVGRKLIKCVHHHREILKFANSARHFYNWLLFLEFFVDGFSIGITMFQLTIVAPFSSEFHSFLSYANAISTQIFMQCWFGHEVEVKSTNLAYALYKCDWTDLSKEVQKHMVIFIIRAQKPLRISAFGLFNLNLENFVKIMRTAWSYFALLRQII